MVASKFVLLAVVLSFLLIAEFADGALSQGLKKSRQHIKPKKSNNKLKATFKKAPAQPSSHRRNAKMNLYNSRSWPSTNSYYQMAASPVYLRSAPATAMYYPQMRWSNSMNYFPSSAMPSAYLRRADEYPSVTTSPTMSSQMLSMPGGSQTPTILDMSAFGGGTSLLENPLSNQNMWSMPETTPSKSKFNLFNSFSLNDDGLFGGLFNQFQ